MKKARVRRTVEREERVRMAFGSDALIAALRKDYPEIPENAAVHFRVPSGGDCSGMDLEVNDRDSLTVSWTTRTREGS